MRLKAYSIKDSVADCYGTPFFAISDPVATRSFFQVADDPQSAISQHPSDYTLYRIGFFDDETGALFTHDTPVFLARASAKSVRVDPTAPPAVPATDEDPRR